MIAMLALLLATITAPYAPVSYACDGVTAAFTVNFPYQASSDLVTTSTTAGGAVTTLALTTDYTTSVSSTQSTAVLTVLVPATKCPAGSTLKIARGTSRTQPTGFRSQTSYRPDLHETAYDRAAMISQEIELRSVFVNAPITGLGTAVTPLGCSVASGSVAGCLASADWTTFNAKQTGPLTGDVTTSGAAATLATSGVSANTYGSTSTIPQIAFDAKGRATSASSLTPALPASAITSGTIAIAQGGTNAATTSQNFVFVGPTSGSGAPSFRLLVAADSPSPTITNQHAEAALLTTCPAASANVQALTIATAGTYLISGTDTGTTISGGTITFDFTKNGTQITNSAYTATDGITTNGTAFPFSITMITTFAASDVLRLRCTGALGESSSGNASLTALRLGP